LNITQQFAVIQRLVYFTHRVCSLAAIALPLVSAGGCALLDKDTWNWERYRDDRAYDIDHRLEKSDTGVKSPF